MTAIDTSLDSITIIKKFTYRGDTDEEFSNTYFMTGDTPSDAASWKVLADNVIADEKAIHDNSVYIVRATGHVAGESVAVWTYDYEAASEEVEGTGSRSGGVRGGGDTAMWIRWPTDAVTSKGKPIFLRTYIHPAWASAAAPDTTLAIVVTALEDYGEAWVTGYDDGDSTTHHRAGPHGVVALTGALASPYVTTRTLERRGRRP